MKSINSLKTNRNNLRIDPINIERDNVNNITKNYWNNTNIMNSVKISPKLPNKISNYDTKKIGFSDTNNSKFFSKIN